jgi:hypothetical protein
MKKDTLTEKQQRFCRNIVAGMTNTDAYLNAYNHKGKITTAQVESTKLLNKGHIQEYIHTISQPKVINAQLDGLNAREQQIKEIQERINICKEKQDEQSLIRYYDMLNKIYALYKESDAPKTTESTLTTLDVEKLKSITSA